MDKCTLEEASTQKNSQPDSHAHTLALRMHSLRVGMSMSSLDVNFFGKK